MKIYSAIIFHLAGRLWELIIIISMKNDSEHNFSPWRMPSGINNYNYHENNPLHHIFHPPGRQRELMIIIILKNNTEAFFPVAGARFAILDLLALRKRQDPQEIMPFTKIQAFLLGAKAHS